MKVATALLTCVDSALLGRKVELSLDWTPASLPWAAPPRAPTTSQTMTTSTAPQMAMRGRLELERTTSGSWLMRQSLGNTAQGAQPGSRRRAAYRWAHAFRAPRLRARPRRLRAGLGHPAGGPRPGRRRHPAR